MALVTMPVGAVFTRRAWTLPAQNQVNRSGWTGGRKVLRSPGVGIWRVSASVKPMSREIETWPWKAFLAVLEGEANTFLMPYKCQHDVASNAVVGAAGGVQGEDEAPISGMPASGLFIQGGRALTFLHPSGKRQMVMLTQDLVANGAGNGTARFRGTLREAPAAGSVVLARDPVCEMAMASSDLGWDEDEGVYKVTFDAEEDF